MDSLIQVGAVSYLNTQPLLYGLERTPIAKSIQLQTDYPSAIAEQLLNGSIDLGLVPVAILPRMEEYFIDADYCIGANGAVASVCVFSQVPLHELTTIYLDYQSRTSVELLRILLMLHFKHEVQLLHGAPGYEMQLGGNTGVLVIGDRAFALRQTAAYHYDLAEAWKQLTNLPFVFAAWVANKVLPEDFIASFNNANAYGLNHIEEVLAHISGKSHVPYDLRHYYTHNISYHLTEQKRAGLQLFLKLLKALPKQDPINTYEYIG